MKNFWFMSIVVKLSGLLRPVTLSSFLSVLSLTVGVATLLVSMALVDSYEKSFKKSIYSVFSHAVVYPNYDSEMTIHKIKKDLSSVYGRDLNLSESHKKEGLLAYNGKVSGVVLEGVNQNTVQDVIDLRSKLIEGDFVLDGGDVNQSPRVFIGKELYKKFNLSIGKVFSVVIPQASYTGGANFSRKFFTYKVGGVIDLGRHSYNRRFIIMDKFHVNKASAKPAQYFSEVRVSLVHSDDAEVFKKKVLNAFPERYWVQSWKDKSGGLLEAIKIERWVIFFLVLILVVVAAFNVSTNLYLNLAKRLKEFSVFQIIGMSKNKISQFMILNGLLLAALGLFFGFILSTVIMAGCNYLLSSGVFVPPEVYKLTSIKIELSMSKFLVVSLATFILCFFASLAPALSVFKLSIVKGLRYE